MRLLKLSIDSANVNVLIYILLFINLTLPIFYLAKIISLSQARIIFIASHILIFTLVSVISKSKIALVLPIGFIIGLLAEIGGTSAGWYKYAEDIYVIKVLGLVPLAVPIMWGVLAVMCLMISVAMLGKRSWLLHVLYASMLMVAYDLAMDPAMVKMGRWIWYVGGPSIMGIPLLNYVFWFAVSAGIYITYFAIFRGDQGPSVSRVIVFLYVYEVFGFLVVEPKAIPIAVLAILLLMMIPYIISKKETRSSLTSSPHQSVGNSNSQPRHLPQL